MEIVNYFDKTFELFLSSYQLDEIVKTLAEDINKQYENVQEDIILVGILNGSFVFISDLVRKLSFEFEVEFAKLKSYDGTESTGDIDIVLDVPVSIEGKHIIIIEDIVDTGLTIEEFINNVKRKNPLSVKTCTLLSKPEVHNDIIDIDFVGLEISPEFVIGYGLDINGLGRQLSGVYRLVT